MTCMGCGRKSTGRSPTTEVLSQGRKITWCCSGGALFLIWVLLCEFDQWYCSDKRLEAFTKGTDRPHHAESSVGVDNAPKFSDYFVSLIFSFLSKLLPSPDGKSAFDTNPPGAVLFMLLNSKILSKAMELLGNDALEGIDRRQGLYSALLQFLGVIGTHPALSLKTVCRERPIWPESINLLSLSFGQHPNIPMRDTSSPLADRLHTLSVESDKILRIATANQHDFNSKEAQDVLTLCRQLSKLSQDVRAKSSASTGITSLSQKGTVADHFVVAAPDELVFATHHYYGEANELQNSPHGRMKHLIREFNILKTGLASGIFVKFAASRLDVMKIMIVAPSDSPYEHGLFEFDLWCPPDYPTHPPKVCFKGTAGGQLYIHPSLYPDGKVCLSLLGTAPGNADWHPGQSTILQVLISIQAMIFGDARVFIHDDREHRHHFVQLATVRFALLRWLENTFIDRLWENVITEHFTMNGEKILNTIAHWARMNPSPYRVYFPDPHDIGDVFMPGNDQLTPLVRKLLAILHKRFFVSVLFKPSLPSSDQQINGGHGAGGNDSGIDPFPPFLGNRV